MDVDAEAAAGRDPLRARWVLVLCALLTVGLGFGKLLLQRGNLPDYARTQANQFEGFVALDDYATRAELFRDWLTGEGELAAFFAKSRSGFHPASLLVPAAVAAASLLVGSIPLAFALLSAAAAVAAAGIAARLAAALCADRARGAATGLAAGVLALAHVDVLRSSAQLQMDPFCSLWTIAAVALLVRIRAGAGHRERLALAVLLATGPLVKISLFPLLALPAACAFLAPVPGERRLPAALRAVPAYAVLPVGVWLGALAVTGALGIAFDDMHDQATQFAVDARYLRMFGIEMALLFQVAPLVVALRPRLAGVVAGEAPVWLAAGLLLAATWAFRLPAIPRLYLPLTALLAVLAAPRLVDLLPRRWPIALGLWAGANYALGAVALVALGR